jgi:hypothetical protein
MCSKSCCGTVSASVGLHVRAVSKAGSLSNAQSSPLRGWIHHDVVCCRRGNPDCGDALLTTGPAFAARQVFAERRTAPGTVLQASPSSRPFSLLQRNQVIHLVSCLNNLSDRGQIDDAVQELLHPRPSATGRVRRPRKLGN